MAVAVFDYTLWATRYPDLAQSVSSSTAATYFAEAGLYLNNTDSSIVQDVNARLVLLNMLVAHLAALYSAIGGQAASPLVGRITNAAEGSVNVQAQFDVPPGTAQWFAQTKYGAAFWAATAPYRTMRYVPTPPYPGNPPW